MSVRQEPPLFVLNDFTILLETQHPEFETVRLTLSRFADLVKSPVQLHTYRMTPLSLWNAMSCGMKPGEMIDFLTEYGKFGVPASVRAELLQLTDRYGLLHLEEEGGRLLLVSKSPALLNELRGYSSLTAWLGERLDPRTALVPSHARGLLKQELLKLGYPVEDQAGFHVGESLPIRLQPDREGRARFELRDYQREAVDAFYRSEDGQGGSGVLLLPCGAGKTVVGIAAMSRLQCATLILTSNVASVRQWKREILDKTDLGEDQVGEYDGATKEVRPVTIATYQILTHRKSKDDPFGHMQLFNERDWGLIVYDEVHLLPAPIFRVTADIQATRRLGLTATLIREDGCEKEVFSLIGPKRYEVPWKQLERQGWIATVRCRELLVRLNDKDGRQYREAAARQQLRIAAENPGKADAVLLLLERHAGQPTLIIGQYLKQLEELARRTGAPLITGATPHEQREEWYQKFREGTITLLVVSKVANFAIDLPDAAVAIQVSGSFGSRQEEAQRLGRILRPKRAGGEAYFYSLVSEGTREQDFSFHRQLFLVEQGYEYQVEELDARDMTGAAGQPDKNGGRFASAPSMPVREEEKR
ncbi:DNA repair helicase XPB [Paenibacillus sp. J31TS4]|uniref:DNA repair helicase XPB n=1 Tax=Paenibacillus sp. J31TS4 TaxID=2807195 RepID=UPI001BCC07C4|nr:DNA repair helicase XPB [Paenibacillus sp. J31TS4]